MLLISFTVAPVITANPSNQNAIHPDNANFTCTSTGVPRPSIQWWRAGEAGLTLLNNPTKYLISEAVSGEREITSRLSIIQTSPSDAGNYTCMVENIVNRTNTTAALTVHGKFSIYHGL